jgi:hypothetical protein
VNERDKDKIKVFYFPHLFKNTRIDLTVFDDEQRENIISTSSNTYIELIKSPDEAER